MESERAHGLKIFYSTVNFVVDLAMLQYINELAILGSILVSFWTIKLHKNAHIN